MSFSQLVVNNLKLIFLSISSLNSDKLLTNTTSVIKKGSDSGGEFCKNDDFYYIGVVLDYLHLSPFVYNSKVAKNFVGNNRYKHVVKV